MNEMAGSTHKEPVSPETKKLRPPTPFSGKHEDLRKFLQEVKVYLWGNRLLYPEDNDKILFAISYMGGGDAKSWAEEFIKKLTDNFSPYDALKEAIHDMKEMQMNNTPIEEHVAKFKMLITKSKLAKNNAVIEYFRETLPFALQEKIGNLPMQPTTLEEWYTWAIQFQNNYIRTQSAIAKSKAKQFPQRGNNTQNMKRPPPLTPRRFYFEPT